MPSLESIIEVSGSMDEITAQKLLMNELDRQERELRKQGRPVDVQAIAFEWTDRRRTHLRGRKAYGYAAPRG